MALRLERDGTAWLENVPLWDGSGSCEGAGPVRYTGTATWTWERGFLLDLSDGRSAVVLPRASFGELLWNEVGVMICGRESSPDRVHFLLGGGPDGELEDPLDP